MADTKISALPASTTPLAGTEVLPIVQGGATRQVSVADLTTGRALSATQLTLTTGNLIVASGQGINFSATPGTGTSELLNDYEEGIHVATITPSTSGSITLSSSGDTLSYTKIGRLVTITGYLSIQSVLLPVGFFSISLPFAIANYGEFAARSTPVVLPDNAVTANIANFVGIALDGASAVRVYLGDTASLQADSAQEMINGGGVFFSFSYNAA